MTPCHLQGIWEDSSKTPDSEAPRHRGEGSSGEMLGAEESSGQGLH